MTKRVTIKKKKKKKKQKNKKNKKKKQARDWRRETREAFVSRVSSLARACTTLTKSETARSLLDCMKFGIFGCPLWRDVCTRQVSAIDSVRNKEVFIPHRCNSVPAKRQVSVRCPSQRGSQSNREGWQRGKEPICYGINNTRPRKRKSRFTKSLGLLFIGSILNEIQPFKNSKIY